MKEKLEHPSNEGATKCYICGLDNPKGLHLDFYRLDEDTVTAELVPPPEWHGWDGLMHGGLQSTLLDEVTGWAVTGLRDHEYTITLRLEVRYRKPVRLNQKLTLIGRIIKETHRGSLVLGQILNQDNEILCEGTAKLLHLDKKRFRRVVETAP